MAGVSTRIPWVRTLAEGAAIVLSILLALALDSWRVGVQERELEIEYLARLVADLDANLEVITAQHRAQENQIKNARAVFPFVSRGEWPGGDTTSVVVASYLASPSPTPTWVDDTFGELKSTGRMALIQSAELRGELLAYYRFLDSSGFTYRLMSTAYRDAVRARMDPDLQLLIRLNCRPIGTECVFDTSRPDVVTYLRWLKGNEHLADGLRRVIVQWTRGEVEFLPEVEMLTVGLSESVKADIPN